MEAILRRFDLILKKAGPALQRFGQSQVALVLLLLLLAFAVLAVLAASVILP